jgi:hypothetical protein
MIWIWLGEGSKENFGTPGIVLHITGFWPDRYFVKTNKYNDTVNHFGFTKMLFSLIFLHWNWLNK